MRNRNRNIFPDFFARGFLTLLLLGLAFIGFALLILAYPELLAIPVSFLLFVIGVYILRAAFRAWRAKRKNKSLIDKFFDF
jgi:membrane protein implicated in regulation of membrane protease activity